MANQWAWKRTRDDGWMWSYKIGCPEENLPSFYFINSYKNRKALLEIHPFLANDKDIIITHLPLTAYHPHFDGE